jgi:hypothetical protein
VQFLVLNILHFPCIILLLTFTNAASIIKYFYLALLFSNNGIFKY